MKKINKIKNKILGNIKNKTWFKNYEYKNEEFGEVHILASLLLALSFNMIAVMFFSIIHKDFILNSLIENLGFSTALMINLISSLSAGTLTSFLLLKFSNKKNKKEINRFIQKSESKEIIKLLNGSKDSGKVKQLINFIKEQPLEKEDLEFFKKMIKKEFNKDELNHIFYDNILNNMIKNKGGIDYNYIIHSLNLLEEKTNAENNVIDIVKNTLFDEKNCSNNFSGVSNIKKQKMMV